MDKRGRQWHIRLIWVICLLAVVLVFSSCQVPEARPSLVEQTSEKGKILANLLEDLPKNFNLLVLVFVGGLAFWGFSRSKQGWVIPAAAVGGMVLMVVFAAYARLVAAGVIALAMALLIWKAVEYQRERNANAKEKK